MRTRTLLLLAVVATLGSICLAAVATVSPVSPVSPVSTVSTVTTVSSADTVAEGGTVAGDVRRTGASSSRPGREPEALAVLHRWDRHRSLAWAAGEPDALTRLYARGSATGRRDVRYLRRWMRRGLRVTGLRQQVAAVRVVRSRGRWLVIVVTERTVGALAVGAGRRAALPAGGWATHRISLVRMGGRWRVAEVRIQPAR